MTQKYTFRTTQGVWINDVRNRALPHSQWPCVRLDDRAIMDLAESFQLQASSGYNCVTLFGLLTASLWDPDIPQTVSRERAAKVRTVLREAHSAGLKVLYGLGVYSWGFDRIIAVDPSVQGDNPHAMCGARPESRQWMNRVTDFILNEFAFDGFHLEAADLGRCNCAACAKESNTAYYSRLNAETAATIRAAKPDAILMVNMCGHFQPTQSVPPEEYGHLVSLSQKLDFLIDPGHNGLFIEPSTRRSFIRTLDCAFGTSGGIWVYPPQRWQRLRWFIPHTRRTGEHLEALYADGGRAVECYLGPSWNPGVEINLAFSGRKLMDASQDNASLLRQILDERYRPRNPKAVETLARVFEEAEDAFFACSRLRAETGGETRGQIHLTRLSGHHPGPPGYLQKTITEETRGDYFQRLQALLSHLDQLERQCRSCGRIARIRRCIHSVLAERV